MDLRWPSGHLSGSGSVGGSAKGYFAARLLASAIFASNQARTVESIALSCDRSVRRAIMARPVCRISSAFPRSPHSARTVAFAPWPRLGAQHYVRRSHGRFRSSGQLHRGALLSAAHEQAEIIRRAPSCDLSTLRSLRLGDCLLIGGSARNSISLTLCLSSSKTARLNARAAKASAVQQQSAPNGFAM